MVVHIAVKGGTDLNCGNSYPHLSGAVERGIIEEEDLDVAVKRLLTARFKVGMFDPDDVVPYAQIPFSVNTSGEHAELALEAARKSIVLLKEVIWQKAFPTCIPFRASFW